mgnify:CR=1 FL=1
MTGKTALHDIERNWYPPHVVGWFNGAVVEHACLPLLPAVLWPSWLLPAAPAADAHGPHWRALLPWMAVGNTKNGCGKRKKRKPVRICSYHMLAPEAICH